MGEILSQPGLEDDVKEIAETIDSLEPDAQEEAREILEKIMAAAMQQKSDLIADLAKTVQNVEIAQKSTEACLAYLKAEKGDKK